MQVFVYLLDFLFSAWSARRISRKCYIKVGVLSFQSSNILGVTSQYCCEGKREKIECWCTKDCSTQTFHLIASAREVQMRTMFY